MYQFINYVTLQTGILYIFHKSITICPLKLKVLDNFSVRDILPYCYVLLFCFTNDFFHIFTAMGPVRLFTPYKRKKRNNQDGMSIELYLIFYFVRNKI